MDTSKNPAQQSTTQELVITRIFDAPRDMVFDSWTDPDQATCWWGPKDFTAPVFQADFRVGGKYLYCMRSPEGKDYWGTGVYREIDPPRRVVATDSFADENGNVVPATYYGMGEDMPLEMLVIATFEELDGRTKLTLEHRGFPAGETREMARQGWNESLDKLAEYLEDQSGE